MRAVGSALFSVADMGLALTHPLLGHSNNWQCNWDKQTLDDLCRQYALLLSYMQYCGSILNPDVPSSVLRYLLSEEQAEDDEFYLHKVSFCALFGVLMLNSELCKWSFSILAGCP